MDKHSLPLQASPLPLEAIPDPSPPPAPPHHHLCYELLTELLICVMHSELRQENNREQQD